MMGMARVILRQNDGLAMAAAFPRQGCVIYEPGMVAPGNAPDRANAFRYLDAMLALAAQQWFAARMGYTPVVDNAPLSGRAGRQLSPPDPKPRLVAPDYDHSSRVQDPVGAWWKKLISQG
jgi:putative spermidine/putrescine transport system substrate-binding protein